MTTDLSTIDDVVIDYIRMSHWTTEGDPVDIKSVYIIEYDVDHNNKPDLLVASPEKYDSNQYRDFLPWRICLNTQDHNYVWQNIGVTFPFAELIAVTGVNGNIRLGYIRHYHGGLAGVMPLEIDKRGAMTTEGIRAIDWSSDEDVEWLQKGREAAQGLIRTYSPEDIAVLRAARQTAESGENPPEPSVGLPNNHVATGILLSDRMPKYQGLPSLMKKYQEALEQIEIEYDLPPDVYPYRQSLDEIEHIITEKGYDLNRIYNSYRKLYNRRNAFAQSKKIKAIMELTDKKGPKYFMEHLENFVAKK